MFLIIENDSYRWLVRCPELVANEAEQYQKMFDEYLQKPENGFRKNDGVCYSLYDFIQWLNDIILKDSAEKAVIVETHTGYVSKLSIEERYHLYF